MKKLIALLLALVMVLGMVACGAKTDAPAADAPAADAPAADAPAADAPAADENTSEVELTEASGDVTTIRYFCTIGAYSALLFDEIDKWNQGEGKEKGVYIDITHNINDGSSAIEMQMQAGNHWDIMQGSSQAWYNQGWLLDLLTIQDDYPELKELIASYEEYMYPGFCMKADGAITNLPLEQTPIKMAVNMRLLESAGKTLDDLKTWDGVVEVAQAITEANPGTAWGYGATTWSALFRRLTFKESAGSTENLWWDPNTGTYSFSQYEIPMKAMKTMYENGWMLGLDDLAIDPIRAEFAAGKVGMFPAPAYDWSVYTNQFPCVDEFVFIDPPTYDGQVNYKFMSNPVANISIDKVMWDEADEVKRQAMVDAFLFISGDELNATIYANAGIIPVKTSIMDGVELVITENKEQWAQMSDLENYTLVPPFPDGVIPLEGDNYATVMYAYMHGDVEWEDAVADLEERYNAAYQAAKEDPDLDMSIYEFEWDHNLD